MQNVAKKIEKSDIMPLGEYEKVRKIKRQEMVEIKKQRRVEVGPYACFMFENYQTMWQQIHEMLAIEKGGDEQIPDELDAYNPLIPNGRELVATIMFEIDNPTKRKTILQTLGGIEESVFLKFDDVEIFATPEEDIDRTTADGKASSVQFVHFHFDDAMVEKFKAASEVVVGFKHPQYGHMATLSSETHQALKGDFD